MDSLRLVVVAQNVNYDLVADVWLGWCRGRVTAVVGSLGSASGGAGLDTSLECLNFVEGEEFVAHICVGVGDWVVGCVDCSTESHGRSKTRLCFRRSELVVAVTSGDRNLEGGLCSQLASAYSARVERLTSGPASICCRFRLYLHSPPDTLDVGDRSWVRAPISWSNTRITLEVDVESLASASFKLIATVEVSKDTTKDWVLLTILDRG